MTVGKDAFREEKKVVLLFTSGQSWRGGIKDAFSPLTVVSLTNPMRISGKLWNISQTFFIVCVVLFVFLLTQFE